MRVLTVRQPWAWAIIHGGKDVENRTRNIAGGYRGPVAIHAGLAKFEQHNMASHALRAAHGTETDTRMLYGCVIGVADLVDAHLVGDPGCKAPAMCSAWAQRQEDFTDVERPAYRMAHFRLADPRPLPRPISVAGRLGLWRPDADLEAAINDQLAAGR